MHMEFEQPDDHQQSITRPFDLSSGNVNERASINTNPDQGYSDHSDSRIYTRHVHQTFPIKFTGCTSDGNLEYHLLLPAGIGN